MDRIEHGLTSSDKMMLWPFFCTLGVFVALAAQAAWQGHGLEYYKTESGPFEIVAFVAMAFALIALIVAAPQVAFGRGWHVTVALLLLMARELDFDKRFTDKGVLQVRLYSGDYSLVQKLIGAAVVLLILVTLYRCVRVGTGPFLSGLRDRIAWAWWFAEACCLVVIAKSLDGLGRKLAPLGIKISDTTDFYASVIEEGLEWVFSMLLILAVCASVRDANPD